MADEIGQFEISDNQGRTEAFSVSATTTFQNIPSSPGEKISGVMFSIDGNNVEISADGGTSYFQFPKDASGFKDLKGGPNQIQVRTSSGTASVKLWIDFEVA